MAMDFVIYRCFALSVLLFSLIDLRNLTSFDVWRRETTTKEVVDIGASMGGVALGVWF